jgi:cytochrome c oxidase assembly protein subunit 15
VVAIAALALLVQAIRRHRDEPALLYPAVLGLVLYLVQSGLGAITVKLNNEWLSVLLHLGNSMLLLACYIVAWVNSRREELNQGHSSLTMPEILLTTALAFGVVLVGAAVAGNGATKACVGWPLCAGEIWPSAQGPLQMLNMAHRLIAGLLGVLLLIMLFRVRTGNNLALRNTLYAAAGLYLLQAGIGAAVVMGNNRDGLVVAQSLHVTFAAATWSVMVLASGILWLQQQSKPVMSRPGERIQAPSATTSN